jgi:nitrite reductase/ring-hydroxylating ferredoxin subunit
VSAVETAPKRGWPSEGPGRAPYWVFSGPDVYEREQALIFRGPMWHYVGLEAEIPEAGSFKCTRIGDAPVIVCRDENGALRAMVNRCAHPGNLVCREELGKAQEFCCVYHAWVYNLSGDLKSAAFRRSLRGLFEEPLTPGALRGAGRSPHPQGRDHLALRGTQSHSWRTPRVNGVSRSSRRTPLPPSTTSRSRS